MRAHRFVWVLPVFPSLPEPLHVVTAWIGNSELVAARHYLQLTDAHFRRAVGEPAAQNAAQKPAEASVGGQQVTTEAAEGVERNSRKGRVLRDITRGDENKGMPVAGFEPARP